MVNKRQKISETQYKEIQSDENKGAWRYEEDVVLECLVQLFGPANWGIAAQYIPGRNGKSCRLRWKNNLNPNINKTPFTRWEDAIIVLSAEQQGHKWSDISQHLVQRTDNSVKNRWYSTLSRLYQSGALKSKNEHLKQGKTLNELLRSREVILKKELAHIQYYGNDYKDNNSQLIQTSQQPPMMSQPSQISTQQSTQNERSSGGNEKQPRMSYNQNFKETTQLTKVLGNGKVVQQWQNYFTEQAANESNMYLNTFFSGEQKEALLTAATEYIPTSKFSIVNGLSEEVLDKLNDIFTEEEQVGSDELIEKLQLNGVIQCV